MKRSTEVLESNKTEREKITPNWCVLDDDAEVVAPLLLGSILERTLDGKVVRVRIVEVEAYHQTDAASHSFKGKTQRTEVMFGPAGYLYVYFTYGMHYCCNIVVGKEGDGTAVLIRAVEPIEGWEALEARRHTDGHSLTNGPAKLCQALGITRELNGHDLHDEPLKLYLKPRLPFQEIVTTTRVGISKDKARLWRFYIKDNPYVSKK